TLQAVKTGAVWLAQEAKSLALTAARAVKTVALKVAELAIAAAEKAWAAARWLRNVAMDANQITVIGTAVRCVVAAVILLNSKLRCIRRTIKAVGDAFVWLWQNAIKLVVDFIVGAAEGLWKGIVHFFSSIVDWVKNVFKKHWDIILIIFTGPIGLVVGQII